MSSSTDEKPHVGNEAIVSFTTKLPERFRVPEDQIVTPASLARYGLSELVNHLLSNESPLPFDFLVDGEFLRTTIGEHLEARGLSSEAVLRIEYVFALSKPEKNEVEKAPDWISGVATSRSPWFCASSYDGTVRLYEGLESRLCLRLSDKPITCIAAVSVEDGGGSHVVAGGKDGTVRCVAFRHSSPNVVSGPVGTLRGPGGRKAVEAVALNADGTLMGSAGWDTDISIWNADVFQSPQTDGAGTKRKGADDDSAGTTPKFLLTGHSQTVTCLEFGASARYPFTLLSSSWDCSLRVWDLPAGSEICNWSVGRAVTSLTTSPTLPQVATSHEDGHVSLWDVRAPSHPSVPGALALDSSAGLPLSSTQSPHRRLASQVVWCPEDETRLASVGHDGLLCVLDPRSPKMPLLSVCVGKSMPVPTKLLCVSWLGRDAVVVGDSDGKVTQVAITSGGSVVDDV
mmetsp:Transcript_4265/g.12081  ORF Transcript_4265/g.12081 Transcript_4265/m.12081 type:complete len:457 (-) Transcript_4265:35-1405(-)